MSFDDIEEQKMRRTLAYKTEDYNLPIEVLIKSIGMKCFDFIILGPM